MSDNQETEDREDKASQIGKGINDLSDAVEGAMIEVSGQVGKATVEISKTMVGSAKEITDISQQFVKASGRLAMTKAVQKFSGLLEESTLEHLLSLSDKRSRFEEKARDLPAGAAKRFALAMIEKISKEESDVLEVAMSGGGLSLLGEEVESPSLALPSSPSNPPGLAGSVRSEHQGHAFAPPPSSPGSPDPDPDCEFDEEVTTNPVLMEGETKDDPDGDAEVRPGDSNLAGGTPAAKTN